MYPALNIVKFYLPPQNNTAITPSAPNIYLPDKHGLFNVLFASDPIQGSVVGIDSGVGAVRGHKFQVEDGESTN